MAEYVFQQWCSTSTAPDSWTQDPAWYEWTSNANTARVTYAWETWTSATDTSTSASGNYRAWTPTPMTPEQAADLERQQAEWKRQEEERLAKQRLARTRAMRLLRALLDKRQRQALRHEKMVPVRGKSGRIYAVDRGSVFVLDPKAERVERGVCLHANGYEDGDLVAATVLALQADEDGTMEKARGHDLILGGNSDTVVRAGAAARRIAA